VTIYIAEGYSAYYYKEKIKGFYIARKEARERPKIKYANGQVRII
jgi:hypothetical protein